MYDRPADLEELARPADAARRLQEIRGKAHRAAIARFMEPRDSPNRAKHSRSNYRERPEEDEEQATAVAVLELRRSPRRRVNHDSSLEQCFEKRQLIL